MKALIKDNNGFIVCGENGLNIPGAFRGERFIPIEVTFDEEYDADCVVYLTSIGLSKEDFRVFESLQLEFFVITDYLESMDRFIEKEIIGKVTKIYSADELQREAESFRNNPEEYLGGIRNFQ